MPTTGSARSRLRVLFMGTPALALPTLEALAVAHDIVAVVTQPDRPSGRGRQVAESAVKRWARQAGVPVSQPSTLRDAAVVAELSGLSADVFVVLAYGLLLPPAILRLPRLGCINIHTSLLPRHRGASPIQAAILAGDAETGVTAMLMDEGLDTGPLLLARRIAIGAADTAGSLAERLAAESAPLILATLSQLDAGVLEPRAQRAELVTVTALLRKEDGRIDWTGSAAKIDRQVRAMQPWPGAWTGSGTAPWKILAVAAGPAAPDTNPGEVVRADDRLLVACGRGESVEITRLQRPGGRPMTAAQLLRGAPLQPGGRFGEVPGENP